MSKRIVVTGPESSGKSYLTKLLCRHFKAQFIGEYSRVFIDSLDRPYQREDLIQIAQGQRRWEKAALSLNPKIIIQDTDLLTIAIWYEYKYKSNEQQILNELSTWLPDLYLLCYPDIEWEFDPQRENPDDRNELFDLYERAIKKYNIPYQVVKGNYKNRFQSAVTVVQEFL